MYYLFHILHFLKQQGSFVLTVELNKELIDLIILGNT